MNGADINERARSRGPGSASEVRVLIPEPVTDRCLSGYLNSRRSSIKVTRVGTNVLAEQTMSWEADGGGQRRGRTESEERQTQASSKPPRCALPCPGGKINASPSATSPRGRPTTVTSGTVFLE